MTSIFESAFLGYFKSVFDHEEITTSWVIIFVSCILLMILYREKFCKVKPHITFQETSFNKKLLQNLKTLNGDYKYPIWGGNTHLQTLYCAGIREIVWKWSNAARIINHKRRERLESADGGVIVLDWFETYLNEDFKKDHKFIPIFSEENRPTVLIIPGVCSTSKSHYIKSFVMCCNEKGYRAVVYHPRGVDEIKTAKIFSVGDTSDFRQTVQHLRKIVGEEAPIIGVGFSLGANVLVKYQGECGKDGNKERLLDGAISISQGYDGVKGIRHLKTSKFYDVQVAGKFKKLLTRHADVFKDKLDLHQVLKKINSVEEYDKHFTCKVLEYPDPDSYYRAESCIGYLPSVAVPLLLLNALDDPLFHPDMVPYDATLKNKNIILATTTVGGHLGWCEGVFLPNRVHWHEKIMMEFIEFIANEITNKNSKKDNPGK